MTSTINIDNQSGNSRLARLNAYSQSRDEFQELVQEQLVGEDSRMSVLYDPTNETMADIFQWSHADNNRWQAYQQEGPAGQEAAQYLEQMVDQRRALANDYMRKFNDLSTHLNNLHQQPGEAGPDLDAMLDNAAAGRSPVVNADGTRMAQADQLLAFWHQNQSAITSLQNSYQTLQAFPKQLSEWLDQNQIERPVAVDQVVEKYRYAGFNGLAETSAELVDTSAMRLDGGEATGVMAFSFQHAHGHRKMDEYGVYSQTDDEMVEFTFEKLQQSGLAMGLAGMEAQVLMDKENRQAWGQYKQLHGPLADTFNSKFTTPLEPRFTLQDIIDNLRADRPAAQLQDGSPHPEADRIEAFATTHSATLNAVVQQQQKLEQMPKTLHEWLQIQGNRHKAKMEVYERHGIEPWKQDNPLAIMRSRLDKASSALGRSVEGTAAASALQSRLNNLLGDEAVPFTLQQLVDNFRWGRPLGTMEDGSLHPLATMIEQTFNSTESKEQLIDYLQSDLQQDDTTSKRPEPYDPKKSQMELISLLNQGQAVLNDSILGTLLMSGKNNTSGN